MRLLETATAMESLIAVLPESILIFVVILLMGIDHFFPRQRSRLALFAIVGLVCASSVAIDGIMRQWDINNTFAVSAFGGAIRIDIWTNVFRLIGFVAAIAALVMSLPRSAFRFDAVSEEEDDRSGAEGEFSIIVLLSAVGISVMAMSTDLLITIIGLEIMSLALYPGLVLARTRYSYEASTKYFLMGAGASAVMLFGMSFVVGGLGSTRYDVLGAGQSVDGLLLFGSVLFLIGLLFKAAAAPFHFWMPDVYETTPAPLGAFMAAGVKAGAFSALVRFSHELWPMPDGLVTIMMPLAALTMFIGNGAAIFQTSFSRLLGYSSIAHTGFLLMGLSASAQTRQLPGYGAVLIYLLTYVPAVIGAFVVVSLTESKVVKDNQDPQKAGDRSIEGLRGLFSQRPVLAICLVIVMASMAGLPPTVGFWAKFQIFRATFAADQMGLLIVALFNSLMAVYYYIKVIRAAFQPAVAGSEHVFARTNSAYVAVLILCSIFLLIFGILPDIVIDTAHRAILSIV